MTFRFLGSSLGKTFLACILLSSLLALYAAYSTWQELLAETHLELEGVKRLLERSAEDRFFQQESMLKLLGERLIEVGAFDNVRLSTEIMDNLLHDNPTFLAYGIAKPNGDIVALSRNLRGVDPPNLLEVPEIAATFSKTLESTGLTIGRTYNLTPLDRWIIPLRYAVRDPQGKVLVVLMLAIDMDGPFNPWRVDDLKDYIDVQITMEAEESGRFYAVYYDPYTTIGATREEAYSRVINPVFIRETRRAAEKATGKTYEAIKGSGEIVGFLANPKVSPPAYNVNSFSRKYQIWTGVRRQIPSLIDEYYLLLWTYTGAWIVFNGVAFLVLQRMWRMDDQSRVALQFAATHDQLTELPNRHYLLAEYPLRFQDAPEKFALLYIDLDNFKFVNDHYGHSVGDLVLKEIAKRLKSICGEDTLLVRQGGDEFIVVMFFRDRDELQVFAERLLFHIRELLNIDGLKISLSASLGIACSDVDAENLDGLLACSDLAMYEAKKSRNNLAFFADHLQKESEKRAVIEAELRNASIEDEMFVAYQPQIEADSGEVIGVEALVRWQHGKLGCVSPDEFIPVAEASGQIGAIGDFVIASALRDVADLRKKFGNIKVSINASVQQLLQGRFRDRLKRRLEQCGVPPAAVTIEVTESLFIEDFKQVENLLILLQADGFGISLDDFGTGYSSLSVLRTMPVDEVKIDKSFVRDILSDQDDKALIRSIIGIGESLKIPVLAEGVEEAKQAVELKRYGCKYFQGYYFAKPMLIDDLKLYLDGYERYVI